MPVKIKIAEHQGTYFITFTCFNWLPLIQLTKAYDSVYLWFDTLLKNGHLISGYVIMPNHVHVLISFINTGQSINTIVGNGKRFMAYEIVKRLKTQGETTLLTNFLPSRVSHHNQLPSRCLTCLGLRMESGLGGVLWKTSNVNLSNMFLPPIPSLSSSSTSQPMSHAHGNVHGEWTRRLSMKNP